MFLKGARFLFLMTAVAAGLVAGAQEANSAERCPRPWVFLDLGETLVDTESFQARPMFYLRGAREYIQELDKRGYPLGLIIDVPETWGRDNTRVASIKDYPTAKWVRTLQFLSGVIAADGVAWKGPRFDWRPFGRFTGRGAELRFNGRVLQPLTDAERKDTGNPVLFERARAMAAKAGCPALYLGEAESHMAPAKKAGMVPFLVGARPDMFFLPPDKIEKYVERYH